MTCGAKKIWAECLELRFEVLCPFFIGRISAASFQGFPVRPRVRNTPTDFWSAGDVGKRETFGKTAGSQ